MLIEHNRLRNNTIRCAAALHGRPCAGGGEIAEVVVVVENQEALLIQSRPEQIRRKAGAATDHLQKFDLGAHLLEEHQIDDVGHVDAGVHHVYADGDLRHSAAHLELLDQGEIALHMAVDELTEIHTQLRVNLLKALDDLLRLNMAGGKDDGFAQCVAAFHLQAVFHQIVQHRVDGAQVDDALAELSALDFRAGKVDAVVIGKGILKGRLFFLGQVVIANAAAHFVGGLVLYGEAHQIFVLNGRFQLVGEIRLAVFQLEGVVGALVFLAAGCGGQADHQRVEIVEQRAVFLENGAVRFVDDNQVKASDAEFPRVVIDQIDHGLVGGKDHAGICVAVQAAAGIERCGHVGQQLVEILMRLPHEAGAVGEKQYVFDPIRLHQHVHAGDGHAGFARAGGHDQQASAAHIGKRLAYAANGVFLIVAVGDIVVDGRVRDILSHGAAQLEQLQFLDGMEIEHPPRRIAQLIDTIDIIAVGVIDHRLIAVFRRHLIGFFDALGAAFYQILRRGGLLNDGQRLIIPAIEHIVDGIAVVQQAIYRRSLGHGGIGAVDDGPARLAQRCAQEQLFILVFVPIMGDGETRRAHPLGIAGAQLGRNLHLRLRAFGGFRLNGRLQGRLYEFGIVRNELP